jgi:EEF1A lysine methyltransferase 1
VLQQFYAERKTQEQLLEEAAKKDNPQNDSATGPLSMAAFAEDWNASQFWYTEETSLSLARALLSHSPTHIAVVSAPSAFAALKKELHQFHQSKQKPELTLLEYDTRFNVWPEFVHYDYNKPTRLPPELRGSCDAIIVDPPFLSDKCQTKAALTVRWLAKDWSRDGLRLLACTGERMGELVCKLYGKLGVQETDFVVRHGSGLSNEFRCFANFEGEEWKWVKYSDC